MVGHPLRHAPCHEIVGIEVRVSRVVLDLEVDQHARCQGGQPVESDELDARRRDVLEAPLHERAQRRQHGVVGENEDAILRGPHVDLDAVCPLCGRKEYGLGGVVRGMSGGTAVSDDERMGPHSARPYTGGARCARRAPAVGNGCSGSIPSVKLFNTLGRRSEALEARDAGRIGIYVCGPTVQARPHVGHGRAAVAFDVVRRYLQWLGYDVTYVQNITDVDDKIIAAAAEQGRDPAAVATEAAEAFRSAYRRLGILEPTVEPKATDHVPDMIEMIEQLIERGHAYESSGDVYFSVRSHPDYGKLSGRNIDELKSGARIEPGEHKRDPLDFALWKAAKPGEPTWDSPWGEGRPGWHIECSAMARRYLGDGFDIHAGGNDLVFPHHENEIAQAEAATGTTFARYWIHNGMVNLAGEKMAKSTGHIVDLLTALDEYPPLAVRLFYLRTHYRKPLEFGEDALADAAGSLSRLWAFRRRVPGPVEEVPDPGVIGRFRAAVESDFDMAGGLAVLFDSVREGNTMLDAGEGAGPLIAAYDEIVSVLGIAEPAASLEDIAAGLRDLAEAHEVQAGDLQALVGALLDRRTRARGEADYSTSDSIRDGLAALGVVIEDTADGVRWHRR